MMQYLTKVCHESIMMSHHTVVSSVLKNVLKIENKNKKKKNMYKFKKAPSGMGLKAEHGEPLSSCFGKEESSDISGLDP